MADKGPGLLGKFMKKNGLRPTDVARALSVSRTTVVGWLEGVDPKRVHRLALEIWTGGAVPESAWKTDSDLRDEEFLASIRPFESRAA